MPPIWHPLDQVGRCSSMSAARIHSTRSAAAARCRPP